jgi:hypothetical protein
MFEGRMHRLANRIYTVWGHFVVLVSQLSETILPPMQKAYRESIK